jgi:hypothetical protein
MCCVLGVKEIALYNVVKDENGLGLLRREQSQT